MEAIKDLLKATAQLRRVLLLLDFDGTLCPIVSHAGRARLTPAQRNILQELASGPRQVALISGRSLADLRQRVGVRGITYCGNFGLAISGPKWNFLHPQA